MVAAGGDGVALSASQKSTTTERALEDPTFAISVETLTADPAATVEGLPAREVTWRSEDGVAAVASEALSAMPRASVTSA
jgi:hypothetical protein